MYLYGRFILFIFASISIKLLKWQLAKNYR